MSIQKIKTILISATFVICLSVQIAGAQQTFSQKTTVAQLDRFLQMANRFYQFNGSAIVARNGVVLLDKGYGFKDIRKKENNGPNTIFQIGSITKEFTSTVILILKEQGKLSLSNRLSDYFPKFPRGEEITIRQLLTHTSGIYNYTSDLERKDSAIVCHNVPKERIVGQFENQPLDFTPGSKYSYSNSGYFLLGMIIEKITGRSWEQNVSDFILAPLGMKNTGFDFNRLKSADKSQGYQFYSEERQQADISWDASVAYAAGNMYSTTGDMLVWARAVAAKKILAPESWKEALAINQHGYGYGWEIDTVSDNKAIGHNGGIPGFSSQMLILPDQDLQIVLLSNVHEHTEVTPISKMLAAIALEKPYSGFKPKDTIPVSIKALNSYVGRYQLDNDHFAEIFVKNGKLYIEVASNRLPPTCLYPVAADTFFVANITLDIQLVFEADGRGEITGMASNQNGNKMKWKKIKRL